ncbi:hypothetical protein SAMN04488688_114116 [Paenibacillus sp. cl141a]|uniref:Polymerase nucleotidyl transferase domain-containing protein n=1 Tax=Paenibacillus lautus TaxID=1401 RepID=A0A385TJK1_PAELA|nr:MULTISPECIES: hypothetical protein [Paenibacillus]AYB44670.1 hypothetical protein D5F53_15930 [Paenibacillus lautus]MBY0164230.1 hypothetical protein [Cytobacillus firmus]SEM54832.1 hypothetical protein SAMN04488688_114116 [Paenibacillus sp. cl141a]VTR60495.1 Uncharacterised protein [Actinobacillus pleuropneumoniae]
MNLEELKQYAMNQISSILGSNMNVVSALAFQGGLGRGKFDSLSDIDLLIGFEKIEDSKGIIKGEHVIDGKKWSVFHLSFDKVSPKQWRDKLRYVYGYETLIFYDRNGKFREICRESLLSEEERKERTVYKIKKLGNRGITYRGIVNEDWRGIRWGDQYDLWVFRGDNFAAHMRLNQAVELLIDLIYSINKLPVPSPKWKHHLVTELSWIPEDFRRVLYEASTVIDMTPSDVERRYHCLISMVTQCIEKSIQLDLLPEDIGSYYFPKFSTHSDNTED